jgi:hypothetical protein
MLFLVSSVFKMDAFDLALLGSRSYFKKIYAGKSDKRAKGIVLLVITILKGGADLRLKKYQAQLAWDAIKRRYDSYCPLSLPGYEFYIDGAKLIEVTAETDEQEEKTRAITFKTFQRYFYEALKKKSQ